MSVQSERRAGGPRVPFHTLVEIGAGEGGSAAFEAESVDVTTAGMRLRTAYLPETDEPLICRFEGDGAEIVVHGEVAWRNEESYGGDFGVRFLEMDQDSLDGLQAIVGDPIEEQSQPDASERPPRVARGTRVRLHIDGLGSPMKARVREGTHGEVLVGSNLEFLRVGRSVDLENVDADTMRSARIERVSVEVEPTSHVPQLIVALRFLDVAQQAPTTSAVHVEGGAAYGDASAKRSAKRPTDPSTNRSANATGGDARTRKGGGKEKRPAPARPEGYGDEGYEVEAPQGETYGDEGYEAEAPQGETYGDAGRGGEGYEAEARGSEGGEGEAYGDEAYGDDAYEDEAYEDEAYEDEAYEDEAYADEDEGGDGRAAEVWSKVKEVGPKFAVVGTLARRWGGKAKDAMGGAVKEAKKKAAQKVKEHKEGKVPLRTTAPPPKGALRGDGTRVRVNVAKKEDPVATKKGRPKGKGLSKRATMMALMGVLLTVVGVGLAARGLRASGDEATADDETASVASAGALPVAAGSEKVAGEPTDPPIVPGKMGTVATREPGAELVADVPLFGARPMSTAAPMAPMAAVPAPAVAAATPPPGDSVGDDDGSGSDMGAMAAAVGDSDEEADVDDAPAEKKSGKDRSHHSKSFGRGHVSDPVVMSLRMNRKIRGVRGTRRSDGFSVEVLGARSREPAGGLRRQDRRIASSKIVNRGSSSRLTIRFRGKVPGYRVQARGSTLRILIDSKRKTASSHRSSRGKKRR